MTDNFNPTEWSTTEEAAELTGYHVLCLAGIPVAVLDKNDKEDREILIVSSHI